MTVMTVDLQAHSGFKTADTAKDHWHG